MTKHKSSAVSSHNITSDFIGGYNGKILRINLSNGNITDERIDEDFCRMYLGGAGFVAYYLWKELKEGVEPLGSENKLVFALGPFTGVSLPGASRNCIGAKSPLTGGIAKCEVGGYWMVELKQAGYDALIIEGKAENPVYMWIHNGEACIRNANHLWGKNTKETQDTIRSELGDEKVQVAMIGPAGENQVRFACIMEGLFDAAGRGGLGAVMGSKNLKAIAVRGQTKTSIVDKDRIKEIRQQIIANPHIFSQYGTGGPVMVKFEESGNLPVRNFREGLFPDVNKIHGGAIKDTIRIGMDGCFACTIRCKKVVRVDEPYKVDPAYGGPEYETFAAIGSNCGIGDIKAIARGNQLCNAYSLDSISTGSTIAFSMECYEKGLLTKKDVGDLELNWGNADAMLKLIDMIAKREGIGDLLAEGTARMAKKIGQGCEAFAMHVKGLEPGMHDPRIKPALALGYSTCSIGADHNNSIQDGMVSNEFGITQYRPLGWLTPLAENDFSPRKVAIYRLGQFKAILNDSLLVCQIPDFSFEMQADVLKAITGWDTSTAEMLHVGERIITLMRLFNVREGFTDADDELPERYFQPKTNGILAKIHPDKETHETAKKYYYTLMNWDDKGIPLPEKLQELYIE